MWRLKLVVSTHSRPKAAGKIDVKNITGKKVSTHSRPKAAGELSMEDVEKIYSKFQHTAARRRLVVVDTQKNRVGVFQHTAARRRLGNKTGRAARYGWFQHTAARRRLDRICRKRFFRGMFQHTAARRRLVPLFLSGQGVITVSTHSRPKAAGTP